MSLATAEGPRIVHALPGRVRIHLPGWEGRSQHALETALRRMRGVSDVRSSPLTRNVLIRFDPEAPPTQRERRGSAGRARIAVRGMDRDPELARRVVERLESRPSVKASASQLTGRVRVEFDENRVQLEATRRFGSW
jgi:hypothetical protein